MTEYITTFYIIYVQVKNLIRTTKSGSHESLQLLFPDYFNAVSIYDREYKHCVMNFSLIDVYH